MRGYRTDLAAEELPAGGGELPGVRSESDLLDGFQVTRVHILDQRGSDKLCKPIGTYLTLDMESFFRREEDSFPRAANLLSRQIRELLPLEKEAPVLVAGLGNPSITPDAVGPETASFTLATRHLRSAMPELFRM